MVEPSNYNLAQSEALERSGDSSRYIISDAQFLCLIDEASSTVTYIGKTAPGSSTSDAVWQICRISISGNITSIEFADSNKYFDNIWDNRGSLVYG